VTVVHAPQESEHLSFWNLWSYGIKNYGVEAISNGMTTLPNFRKIGELVQQLMGTDTYTERLSHKPAVYFSLGRKVG